MDILNNKDLLYQEYIINNLSAVEIANKYNVTRGQIQLRAKKYGFKKSKEQRAKCIEESNIRKYGCKSTLQVKEVQDKIKATNLEKYGVENPMQNLDIYNKAVETNIDRYGVKCSLQNEIVKNKAKQTNLEKYGVENPFCNKCIRDKAKNTILNKYGTEYAAQNKEIYQKVINTNIDRYGTKCSLQNDNVKEKSKATIKHKYGVDHISRSDEIKSKIKQTNMKCYGVEYTFQSSEIKEKIKTTNLEKYGVEYVSQYEEFKKKREETCINKYGYKNQSLKEESIRYFKDEYTARSFIEENCLKYHVSEIASLTNLSYKTVLDYIHKYNLEDIVDFTSFESSYEKEIKSILTSWGITNIITRDRSILEGKEIDIYLPDYNFGIEFNGSYWHSDEKKLNQLYHQQKSLKAKEKNVFIYHIFGYEWMKIDVKEKIINQIKNILNKNEHKIYARKCEIKEISTKTKNKFLNENHLQSEDRSTIKLGLFYEDELVSVMTFVKPRFTNKYNWELSRFCSKANYNVVGGASKLFKYFINNYLDNNETVLSYSNIAKTSGKVYKNLGFEFSSISKPNYIWWKNDNDWKSRYQTMMKNENQIMTNQGYHRIYDCGNYVWIYTKKKELE